MDGEHFLPIQLRLEEQLRALEERLVNLDDLTVGQLIILCELLRLLRLLQGSLVIESDEAVLLLNSPNYLQFGGSREVSALLLKADLHPLSEVTAGKVYTADGVRERVSFINGNRVGNTVTGIQNNTSGPTRAIQRKNGLYLDIEALDMELIEHNLAHLLAILLGILWCLCDQDVVLLRVNAQLIAETVLPQLGDVIPIRDDTVLNRVFEDQNATLGLGFITDVLLLGLRTLDGDLVLRTTNYGWEHGPRGVITRKTSLGHTGTVVYDDVQRLRHR